MCGGIWAKTFKDPMFRCRLCLMFLVWLWDYALKVYSDCFVCYLGGPMLECNCFVFRLWCWCLFLIGCHSRLHKRVFLGGRTHCCLLGLVTGPKLFGGLHMLSCLPIFRDVGLIFLALRAH